MAIRDSSNENSTNGNNTSKVGQSITGSKKVAKTEELYSDKNIKITRTGGNIIIDNLTDKEINIESTIVINNSIEATPFSSSQSSIDPKGKQSVSISEFVAVNPGQKVEESDEKAKKQTTISIK
ncbi:MAG: hypothetical protein ACLS5G_07885 [Streptococcus sp.]